MAETVRIQKTVDVQTEVSADVDVTVYSVHCAERGHGNLGFSVEADSDGDLHITADPCEQCKKEAADAGHADAEAEAGERERTRE